MLVKTELPETIKIFALRTLLDVSNVSLALIKCQLFLTIEQDDYFLAFAKRSYETLEVTIL